MNKQIQELSDKVKETERLKEAQQEEMKKALMRGVCALNLEAMTLFKDSSKTNETNFISNKDITPSIVKKSEYNPSQEAFIYSNSAAKESINNVKQAEPVKQLKQSVTQSPRVLVTRHC